MEPIAKLKIGKNIRFLAQSENKIVAVGTPSTVTVFQFLAFDKAPPVLYEYATSCLSLAVSKNGRYVAFSDVYEITRIDLSNGELKTLPYPSFVTTVSNDGLVVHCNHLEVPDYVSVFDGNINTQVAVTEPLVGEIFASTFENKIAVCSGTACGVGRIGDMLTVVPMLGKTVGVFHNGTSFVRVTGDGLVEELQTDDSASGSWKSETGIPIYGILPSGKVPVGVTLDGKYVSLPTSGVETVGYFSRLSKNAEDHLWFYVSPVPPVLDGNVFLVYAAFLGTMSSGYIPISDAKKYGYSHCRFVTTEGSVEFPISDIPNGWVVDNISRILQANLIKPIMDRWKSFSGKARPPVSIGMFNAYVFGSETAFAIDSPDTSLTIAQDITTYVEAE